MRNIKNLIVLALLTCTMLFTLNANADGDPVTMLQSVANQMISELKTNKATLKTKPDVVYKLAYRYVVPHANVAEMSRRVLPPDVWNKATSAQKAQFEKEFTRLLIRTYASALTSYKDQVVQFYPVRGGYAGKSTIEVRSQIVGSDSSPISVTYRLVNSGGTWRLYDMSVEGVSMLSSFRSQFSDILSSGDMGKLLERMTTHNQG